LSSIVAVSSPRTRGSRRRFGIDLFDFAKKRSGKIQNVNAEVDDDEVLLLQEVRLPAVDVIAGACLVQHRGTRCNVGSERLLNDRRYTVRQRTLDQRPALGRIAGLVVALAILQTISSGFNLLGLSADLTLAIWGPDAVAGDGGNASCGARQGPLARSLATARQRQ
jgi:hypothetical protein